MDIMALKRCLNGRSQKEVAAGLNVSSQRLNNYVNGKREPDNDMLQRMADYFDVTVDYLLGREENEKPAAISDGLSGGDISAIPEFELDELLVELLVSLNPADTERVIGYLEGLRAKHK